MMLGNAIVVSIRSGGSRKSKKLLEKQEMFEIKSFWENLAPEKT